MHGMVPPLMCVCGIFSPVCGPEDENGESDHLVK